jgi:PAS domain S-box-containing protein
MRIFHKLLLGFFSITLLIWTVGFFAIQSFQKTREKTVSGYAFSIANMVLKDIDRQIYQDFVKLKASTKGDTLQRTVEASNKVFEEMADREEYIDRMDQEWLATPGAKVTPFMQQILDLPLSKSFQQEQIFYKDECGFALFPELFVTNRFGALAAASNKTTDYRQNDEDWWKEAWQKGFFFGSVEYDQSAKIQAIALAARVENERGEPVGVFKGMLNTDEIEAQLRASEKNLLCKSGRLFLLDSSGRYIYPVEQFGKEAKPFLKDGLSGLYAHGGSGFETLKNETGDPRKFVHVISSGYKEYSGRGWALFVSYDENEIFEPNRKMEAFVFLVAGGATGLSLIIGLLLALSFSRPLGKLRRAADRFGEGDLGAKIGIDSRDEFWALARDFEAMAENLKNTTTSIKDLDREIEEHKLLEKVSLENSLLLQKLMDSIPSPVFYEDISGVYIGCNRAFEIFFGISQKDLMGKKAVDLFPPELARIYQEKDAELFAIPGVQVYEAEVQRAGGEPRNIVFQKATFVGPSGEVSGIIGIILDITERKRAEEALSLKTMLLESQSETSLDGILAVDNYGHVILFNKRFGELWGIPQSILDAKDDQQLLGCVLKQLKNPSEFSEKVAYLYGHQEEKSRDEVEFSDGRCFDRYSSPMISAKEENLGRIWFFRDITAHKLAEQELRESEERHRTLFECAGDAIVTIGPPSWKFKAANSAAKKMFKLKDGEELVCHGLMELSPECQPDGRVSSEKGMEMIETTLREGSCFFEWMHKRPNGEDFLTSVLLTRMEVRGEISIQASLRDISAQRMAEIKIRQLSQAMEQSPSCVVITDKEGKIEYVNQSFVNLTGYSLAETLGQNPRILQSGEQPPEFYKELWETILDGKDWQGQFCNKKKSGALYWELAHIAPIRDEKGEITHFVAVKEDITYRRQIEEKLRHTLRMEAVGRLAGGIAHDFNNMLTVINGYSGYLMGKMKPEDPYFDKICQIRDAGDCAATIVRQLLNLSRKEVAKPEPIRIGGSIGRMRHMINRLLGDDIEFKEIHAAEADFVTMDPGQMEQVLLNLLVNAREAMPGGGVLTAATDLVRMEEVQEKLMPPQKREGEFVRITVRDTGVGIDPALRARIFEPFFTTKKRGMNTGLGLSIVYGIVEQAGGAVSFESQLGRGTTFRVYLPRARRIDGPNEKLVLEELPAGKGKILLVEDENQVREFALQVLRERGYDVRATRSGEEALAMFEEDPGRKYDLVLTDLTMPKMNGKELVSRIREKIPDLKVIFMSGYSEQEVADMENSSFLQKPFSHRALAMKVWEVLGR